MDDDARWRTMTDWWWCEFGCVESKLIVSCLLLVVVCAMVLRRGIDEQVQGS